jgi:hypothetical protein
MGGGGGEGEERKYPEASGVAIDFSVQTFHIRLLGMAGGEGEGAN